MTRTMLTVAALCCATTAAAQTPAAPAAAEHDATDLAKKTQNPVGDLISVPLQFNFNSGGGYLDQAGMNLNIQPVIPIHIGSGVTAIARTIVPVNTLPGPDGTRYSGFGDIQEEIFFSPAKAGSLTWGVGPIISMPTSTTAGTATGTWAAGPAAVVALTTGPWVLGGLMTQAWPMSDVNGDPKTDAFLVQPFVNYNFGKGWALAFAPSMTANWNAPSGQQWTVPLGLGITHTTVFAGRPMSLGVQYYDNVKHPDAAPGQQLRFVISLLYPGGK
jgi:hypothetical protein